jgi:hypothetical protein
MTDDRELLELAAKAAEVEPWRYDTRNGNVWDAGNCLWVRAWNPLTDDGDALRLAVKLGFEIVQFSTSVRVCPLVGGDDCHEGHGNDPYAATRRAIVRAAAEIGRGKHDQ